MAYIIDDIINYFANKDALDKQSQMIDQTGNQIDQIALPKFSGSYTPELAGTPYQLSHQQIEIDPAIRKAQMAGLQSLMDRSNGVADSNIALGRYNALHDAQQTAKGQQDAIMANARARGMGGSGLEFALRDQAGQSSANREQEGGLNAVNQAAMEQLQAQGEYNQGLSSLRGQDTDLAAQNAAMENSARDYNVGQNNQQMYYNNQLGNSAQQYNLGRGDTNAMNTFNATMGKQGMKSALLNPKLQNAEAQGQLPGSLASGVIGSAGNIALAAGLGGAGLINPTAAAGIGTGNPSLIAASKTRKNNNYQ